MVDARPPSAFERVKNFLGNVSLIHWLFCVALSFTSAWKGTSLTAQELSQPQLWVAAGTFFFGTLAITISVTKVLIWSASKIRRWRFPHSLAVIPHGGTFAAVALTHQGEQATWEAHIRIVETADGSVNPNPIQERCFLRKDGKTLRSLGLKDGESASITLATIEHSEWGGGSWLSISSADRSTHVPDDGVTVELLITANPPMAEGVMRRRFRISTNRGRARFRDIIQVGGQTQIAVEDVSRD